MFKHPRKPLTTWERALREEFIELNEKRSLSITAYELAFSCHKRDDKTLRTAAKLIEQPGELGFVARCALAELKRRGL